MTGSASVPSLGGLPNMDAPPRQFPSKSPPQARSLHPIPPATSVKRIGAGRGLKLGKRQQTSPTLAHCCSVQTLVGPAGCVDGDPRDNFGLSVRFLPLRSCRSRSPARQSFQEDWRPQAGVFDKVTGTKNKVRRWPRSSLSWRCRPSMLLQRRGALKCVAQSVCAKKQVPGDFARPGLCVDQVAPPVVKAAN